MERDGLQRFHKGRDLSQWYPQQTTAVRSPEGWARDGQAFKEDVGFIFGTVKLIES